MDTLESLAIAHLLLLLRPLNEALRLGVRDRSVATARLVRGDLSAFCVTDEQVELLLSQVEAVQKSQTQSSPIAGLDPAALVTQEDLRAQARAVGATLPFDRLVSLLALTEFEQHVLLICAAPEIDQSYERIFSFILDDLTRRAPCTELLSLLTSSTLEERIEKRHALSAFGRLRRFGLLVATGDSPSDLRQEFRLAPGLFDFLSGGASEPPATRGDRSEVVVPPKPELPPQIVPQEFVRLCDAFRNGRLRAFGIWGSRQDGTEELVLAFASTLGRPLRRLLLPEADRTNSEAQRGFDEQLRIAAGLGALLWLDTGSFAAAMPDRLQTALSESLSTATSPLLLSGENPWRPARLLRKGAYAEIELPVRAPVARQALWSRYFPELHDEEISALAARYSLASADILCVSDLARIRAELAGSVPQPVNGHVPAACALVTQGSSSSYATLVRPTRTPDDLVLPPHLHRHVMEIAAFFNLRPRVDEQWGFGRLAHSSGFKVLFTGDPGTGKTLAAEVIAGVLKLPLLRVDLARITSKWVGETEKNLETAFREAEESQSVLFFDEAEALFGRRAEVRHGTDRYANLEVSYLLQKLESCRGLVILASNVKDQIDSAFVRRFQEVIHFPRPALDERLRIWRLAFSPPAPLDPDVDLEVLARLDMTGAAIVNAARTSAMLAAQENRATIAMEDIVRATARQFRREARVLTASELGSYGGLLKGNP